MERTWEIFVFYDVRDIDSFSNKCAGIDSEKNWR